MGVKKIGELLVESALITEEQLEETLKESRLNKGTRIGEIIVKKGYATEIDIAQTLAFQLKIPFADMSTATVDPEAVNLVSEKLAQKYLVLPIYFDKKILKIAMVDPMNLNAIDDLRVTTRLDVQPCVATLSDVTSAIRRHYHINEPLEELMVDLKKDKLIEVVRDPEANPDISDHVRKSTTPPIIKMVDSIIIHGVDNGASDIHLEPQERAVKLRIRVDGIMRETMQLPKWVQGPVTSRIKLMTGMDITERRVSQDGRMRIRIGDKSVDMRVSTLPTQYGEKIVIRILDPKSSLLDLESIGLFKDDLDLIIDLIERPQGVVLVTGPTGSGKTSMLYAMIRRIKKEAINIVTIEDPIEYELNDVSQVAVNEKTGLTFSYTLRSVLRQDPDVIMVGEMRDTETAIIAYQASMTGHLVFSTLHTNDAVSSVIRLKNIGIPSYMIASALNGIVAQRLVRKICPNCKEEYTPGDSELKRAGLVRRGKEKFFRGTGCKTCNNSGYSGRLGVFEVLKINSTLKNLISADAAEEKLVNAAKASGMRSLKDDGLRKAEAGLTTIEELARVVYLSREDDHKEGVCPNCMKAVTTGVDQCPHCGQFILKNCRSCGKVRHPDWVICPFCSARFDYELP